MHWIGYARTGKELEVEAELRLLGIKAEVPRKVDAIRRGKKRYAEANVSALWPNVVVITCSDDDWHRMRGIRHLARTTFSMCEKTYLFDVLPCLQRVQAQFRERMMAIQAGQRVEEYKPGDEIRIVGGAFADQVAVFRRVVESQHDIFPKLEAGIEVLGRVAKVQIDPINARKEK